MEDSAFSTGNPITAPAAAQDPADDGCSICLEPFSLEDPATVTNCKHEYHLQCILDWSQRSKECPICWQFLVLKDPDSQELLAAVEIERSSRSRHRSSNMSTSSRIPLEDFEFHDVPSFADETDLDERIMQHLAAAAIGRTHHLSRRERHRSSGLAHSQFLVFAAPSNGSDVEQEHGTTLTGSQGSSSSVSPAGGSPTTVSSPSTVEQPRLSLPTSPTRMGSDAIHSPFDPRNIASRTPPSSPQRSRPSELLSFSESLKSKLSAASSRYKETISKSTRGFKEKLLARNNSVKELSKEVQREVTAGIAGVARMMERLDPTTKRTGGFTFISSGTEGTSESSPKGNGVQGNLIADSGRGNPQATSSNVATHASGPEAHVQDAA